jgi:hypothetical protein
MVWNLFGGGKKKEAARQAKLRAKQAMPPVMAPDESHPPPAAPKREQEQLDALTVMAAIESAKKELADRERTLSREARRPPPAGGEGEPRPARSPAEAAQQKKQLIQAAMTVHRLKQSALSELSPQDRERLRSMAEASLGLGGKTKPRS